MSRKLKKQLKFELIEDDFTAILVEEDFNYNLVESDVLSDREWLETLK